MALVNWYSAVSMHVSFSLVLHAKEILTLYTTLRLILHIEVLTKCL